MIEKHASKVEAVYTPHQWFDHVREAVMNAGYRIEVTEMQQSNFRNYRDHLRKQYTELKIWTINLLIFLMLFGLTLAWVRN